MKLLALALTTVLSQSFGLQSARAQDVVPAFVSAVSISTNQAGGLAYHEYGNRDIIRACAAGAGLTNLEGLSLVYDRTADALEVVSGTNDTVVCTPLSFSGGTSLSNTNGTRIERLTFVYAENNTVANGTLAATEQYFYGPSNQVAFVLAGQLQYSVSNGANGPTIYKGRIFAGSGFGDWEEEGPMSGSLSTSFFGR